MWPNRMGQQKTGRIFKFCVRPQNSTEVEQCLYSLRELSELVTVYIIRNAYELATFHAIEFPVLKIISGVFLCENWFYNPIKL